jgi:hypothetical protein
MAEGGAHDFDFWVGTWEVRWGEDRSGRNRIRRILDDRVVLEEFDGRPGSPLQGLSVSIYDADAGLWRQTWVDNQASYLDLAGAFTDGAMVLEREARLDGRPVRQRATWMDIERDRFHWLWQLSEDKGESWRTLWELEYSRLPE